VHEPQSSPNSDFYRLIPGAEFNHLGIASNSIEKELGFFEMLGYRPEDTDFVDSVQGVRGRFLVGGGPRIELLENLPGSKTLDPWLGRGGRVYHFGYMVPDLTVARETALAEGAIVVRDSLPSLAFSGRLICFLLLRNRLMIELIGR